jgi:hypothetical protein
MPKVLQWFTVHWESVTAILGTTGAAVTWFFSTRKIRAEIRKEQVELADRQDAQKIDSLAAKVRSETLAMGGAGGGMNVSSDQAKKILGPEHEKLVWEVMGKLENQGHARIRPFRVGGSWWEVR